MPVKFVGDCPKHGLVMGNMKQENYIIHGPKCPLCWSTVIIKPGSKIVGRKKAKSNDKEAN